MTRDEFLREYEGWRVVKYSPTVGVRCPVCHGLPEGAALLMGPTVCRRDRIFFDPDLNFNSRPGLRPEDTWESQLEFLHDKYALISYFFVPR